MFFKFRLPCRKSWLGCLVSLSLSFAGSPLLAQTAPASADSAAKKPAATTSGSNKAKKKTNNTKATKKPSPPRAHLKAVARLQMQITSQRQKQMQAR